jgi:L-asparaginase / beta-aspartyl-peptidase
MLNLVTPKIVVHGGLVISPSDRSRLEVAHKKEALSEAIRLGAEVLLGGGTATEACVAAVTYLEDNELFNAGYGASLNEVGEVELDALLYDGEKMAFGAVAIVNRCRNPIRIAEKLASSRVSCLAGPSAESAAERFGIALTLPSELVSERARLIKYGSLLRVPEEEGTVGAVARDARGNLAAASSSGGLPGKEVGRLADSCMPGIGAYANNLSAAVACTGHGETIMRLAVARDVAAFMELRGAPLLAAARAVGRRIVRRGGAAGFIAIDRDGACMAAAGLPDLLWGAWSARSGNRVYGMVASDSASVDPKLHVQVECVEA